MAKRITDLPELTAADKGDLIPVVDVSGNVTKRVTFESILMAMYPVGSIYMNADVNTNPSSILGFGTWDSFGAGRVLAGVDASDTDFDTLGKSGGAKTHTLTENEMPSHSHGNAVGNGGSNSGNSRLQAGYVGSGGALNTGSAGGGDPHNNLQPYITVAIWKRTA